MVGHSKPLSILFAATLLPRRNGGTRCTSELVTALAASGHRVTVIAPMTSDFTDHEEFDRATHPGVTVKRFVVPYFDSLAYPPPPAYRERQCKTLVSLIGQAIAEERFDVVVLGKETFVFSIPELLRRHGLPCVAVSHGTILLTREPDYPQDYADALLAELGRADLVIACANHVAARIETLGLRRVKALPNGIDTTAFRPGPGNKALAAEYGIAEDAIVIGHISGLYPVKRPSDLIESAAIALRDNPKLFYLIVGDGKEREELAAAVARLGIAKNVAFTGWQPYERVPDYVRLSDIVAYPSESEGLCRGYLEAMAAERVLIASDIPAAREVVADGVSGLLFAKGDTTALAEKTLSMAADGGARQRIGRAARQTVLDAHQLPVWAKSYEEVLLNVAATYAPEAERST